MCACEELSVSSEALPGEEANGEHCYMYVAVSYSVL